MRRRPVRRRRSPRTEAQQAQDSERVKQWQHAQRAKGSCRCGARIAEGSRSRCSECLERRRRTALSIGQLAQAKSTR